MSVSGGRSDSLKDRDGKSRKSIILKVDKLDRSPFSGDLIVSFDIRLFISNLIDINELFE